MRPSIRFEVFKRDGFVCTYCGRRPPQVTLEVDHIIPRAEGGDDGMENLTTSCWDCNHGKGAKSLDERAPVPDLEERAELIRERERQLRLYHAAKAEERSRRDAQLDRVWNHWFEVWNAVEESLPTYYVPKESALLRYIDAIGPDEVMDAMDIAGRKFSDLTTTPLRYFYGVCKRKTADAEGRVAICVKCGHSIVLSQEEVDEHGLLAWTCGECTAKEKEAGG